jgi:ubiquinone/menaquinone biosynthesis C-methylase UbiE
MSHSPLLNEHVLKLLPSEIEGLVILDVGCGYGEWGFFIRTRKVGPPYMIGIDIWRPHLNRLRPLGIYEELVQVKVPILPFKEKSVDVSLACEILEHLSKHDGYLLLDELERVSRSLVIISSPMGLPQEEIYGNPYEKHISEWKPEEFENLGYKVKVVDAVVLPRTLKLVDKMRRAIFRLPHPRLVIAHKILKI